MLGLSSLFDVTKTEIVNKTNGNVILFRGIQTGSKSNTANLKSLQGVSTLVIDEAEEVTDETTFDRIDLSVRQKGVKNRVIIIMNPATKEHIFYKKFFESTGINPGSNTQKGNVTYIHTDYRDNSDNLDESFLHQVEHIKLNNPIKYEHVILGGWLNAAEGVIYSNWMIGEFDNSLPVSFGMDFGFSLDQTTLTKCAVDKKRQKIYLQECVYKTGMTTNDIYLDAVRYVGTSTEIIADSAEPRLISELKAKGLNIKACIKGAGSITAGISALQDYQLIVSPNSTNLVKELNNYVWHDKKSGTPIDAYNHILDGVRYACYPIIKSAKKERTVMSV